MAPRGWIEKPVSRRTVFRGRLLTVHVDRVRLPDGRSAEREIVSHPGAVAVVPLDRMGRVVLVRQYRHALGRVTLEVPAGKRDGSESPLACARRELAEETSLRARRWKRLATLATTPGFTDERIALFLATGLSPAAPAACDPDEFLRVRRMPLAAAIRSLVRAPLSDSKTLAALLLAARTRRG